MMLTICFLHLCRSLQARFLIIKQKYIEAVESGSMSAALQILRKELAPLKTNELQLRKLAGQQCTGDRRRLLLFRI